MKPIAIVSGRGYGKKLLMAKLKNPEAPTAEELANAIPLEGVIDNGISFEAGDAVTTYPATNYSANLIFRSKVLVDWYPPRDELIDRLNNRLRGKEPAPAINTRYWRGL